MEMDKDLAARQEARLLCRQAENGPAHGAEGFDAMLQRAGTESMEQAVSGIHAAQ